MPEPDDQLVKFPIGGSVGLVGLASLAVLLGFPIIATGAIGAMGALISLFILFTDDRVKWPGWMGLIVGVGTVLWAYFHLS